MGTITVKQLNTALVTTMEATFTDIKDLFVRDIDEIPEAINDPPTLLVYPLSGELDTDTDRATFGKGVVKHVWHFNLDLLTRNRSHSTEDTLDTVVLVDQIIDVLDAEIEPLFTIVIGVRSFNYEWSLLLFEYGEQVFSGARFVINCEVY